LPLAPKTLEPVAGLLEAIAHLEQLRLLAIESFLGTPEPLPGGADLTLQALDPGAEALDRGGEHALPLLHLLDLCALLLDPLRHRRGRQPRQGHKEIGRKGQGQWNPEGLLHLDEVPASRLRG
jgi:hypothetical protein